MVKLKKKILGHSRDKYITTQECNKLTTETFAARLAQAKLELRVILLISLKRQILVIK